MIWEDNIKIRFKYTALGLGSMEWVKKCQTQLGRVNKSQYVSDEQKYVKWFTGYTKYSFMASWDI